MLVKDKSVIKKEIRFFSERQNVWNNFSQFACGGIEIPMSAETLKMADDTSRSILCSLDSTTVSWWNIGSPQIAEVKAWIRHYFPMTEYFSAKLPHGDSRELLQFTEKIKIKEKLKNTADLGGIRTPNSWRPVKVLYEYWTVIESVMQGSVGKPTSNGDYRRPV